MATRQEVYRAIDGEREYQDSFVEKNPERCRPNPEHSVGEYLTMARYYANEADKAWATTAGDETTLHVVRKLAAIYVHCMEEHGAPHREMPKKAVTEDAFSKPDWECASCQSINYAIRSKCRICGDARPEDDR